MIPIRCKHLAKDGTCTGVYEGYACIRTHCALYKEARLCEHHDVTGDYCRKYNRFGCVGKDSCATLADYLDAVADCEQA